MQRVLFAAIAVLALLPYSASAQGEEGAQRDPAIEAPKADACQADVEKFCKGITPKPGQELIGNCLKEHEAELSQGCQLQRERARQLQIIDAEKRNPNVWNGCNADIAKFCKDTKPGAHRIENCLKPHEAELSDACKAQGERARQLRAKLEEGRRAKRVEGRQAKRGPCQADVEKFCKDIKPVPGQELIGNCLREHEDELSEGCTAARAQARERKKKRGSERHDK